MLGEISLTGLTSQGQLTNQLNAWKVGQVLEAVALSRPAAERLQLRIGGMELEARTQAPIQAGDRVLLKVLSAGETPVLQVVPAATASANAADVVNHAIRQLLPRQLSTPKVIDSLVALLAGDGKQKLPPNTRNLIETLLARIPTADKLADQAQLRQLVNESGLFRESRQLVGRPDHFDMKQALVQLARQLNQLVPQKEAQSQAQTQLQSQSGKADGQPSGQQQALVNRPTVAGDRAAAAVPGSVSSAGTTVGSTAAGGSNVAQQAAAAPNQATNAAVPGKPAGQASVAGQANPVPEASRQLNSYQQLQMMTTRPAVERPDLLPFEQLLLDTRQTVDGGIARLIWQQAQSLPQQEQSGLRWVFELPYREGDEYRSLPLVIEREAEHERAEGEELGWRVELEFDVPTLGSVQAHVLVRGDKVSASLWTEYPGVAQAAETALPSLETALVAAGLQVGAITCQLGKRQSDNGNSPRDGILNCTA